MSSASSEDRGTLTRSSRSRKLAAESRIVTVYLGLIDVMLSVAIQPSRDDLADTLRMYTRVSTFCKVSIPERVIDHIIALVSGRRTRGRPRKILTVLKFAQIKRACMRADRVQLWRKRTGKPDPFGYSTRKMARHLGIKAKQAERLRSRFQFKDEDYGD